MYRHWQILKTNFTNSGKNSFKYYSSSVKNVQVPESADVVIVGGGTIGCHMLFFLARRGISAVLLERAKLTSGTTWHTNGAMWRLRPNDTDIHLLGRSFEVMKILKEETEHDPGYINNGGIFIARNKTRLDEYKRLSTIGNLLQIENYIMSADEITEKLFPLLDPNAFVGGLYSPGDGCIDPALLCTSLVKDATAHGGQIFENCPVNDFILKENLLGFKRIDAVVTPTGTIKTNVVINATGVWAGDVSRKLGLNLPIIPMKHSFIVSESIEGLKGLPNVRDHDHSIVFRIQGSTICLGGYEHNPILLDSVPEDFQFQLFDLDWDTFDEHVQGAENLCPAFGKAGIKTTICGPESFTPDHKPLMGPDPCLDGLFHISGFNSAGIMYGGGCAEQLTHWILNGKPEIHMYSYDVRRFSPKQTANHSWAIERSQEAYATNYHTVFLHAQPLAARNLIQDPLHETLINKGAIMEEKQGWERPNFFIENQIVRVPSYDWQGAYGNTKLPEDNPYKKILSGDAKYGFSDHHDLIGTEARNTKTNASIFNLTSYCKLVLNGPQATEAIDWIFTNDINGNRNQTSYTCSLNNTGGIECNVYVTPTPDNSANNEINNLLFKSNGYYIVGSGHYGYKIFAHIQDVIKEKEFNVQIENVTENVGILLLQGPNSIKILEKLTTYNLHTLLDNYSVSISLALNTSEEIVRVFKCSSLGDMGFELHIPYRKLVDVYNQIWQIGKEYGLQNAGFRAFNSISCENGHILWDYDIQSDDTPVEANLTHLCRPNGQYKGRSIIDAQQNTGVSKKLLFLELNEQIPIWGLESIYRNGKPLGYLRRAEYGYNICKPIGKGYICQAIGQIIDEDFVKNGQYEIEVLGKRYLATCR